MAVFNAKALSSKGYDIFDYDGTGMLEIQKLDSSNRFENDEQAVAQAIKDGIKIIPIEELPENFDRKYLGWIDTPDNRTKIAEYCERVIFTTINVDGIDVRWEFKNAGAVLAEYWASEDCGVPSNDDEVVNGEFIVGGKIVKALTFEDIIDALSIIYWSEQLQSK